MSTLKKITLDHPSYPLLLKQIFEPPKELYVLGNLKKEEKNPLAVVGTRLPSSYGKVVASSMVRELASRGITIISGLALGIDGISHQACLEAGGKTIAVFGCGLDIIYPYCHKKLAEEIVKKGGALISEYPPGTKPDKWQFPARNRIIAGLSQATLVIEAPKKSGALITAFYALNEGRDVLSVPGEINKKNSEGTNNLIKLGAKPVTTSQDVLEVFNITGEKKLKEIKADSKEEEILLNLLAKGEPIHIDKLIKLSKLSSPVVLSTLTVMEINKKIKNLGQGFYSLY